MERSRAGRACVAAFLIARVPQQGSSQLRALLRCHTRRRSQVAGRRQHRPRRTTSTSGWRRAAAARSWPPTLLGGGGWAGSLTAAWTVDRACFFRTNYYMHASVF
jgi:hypothetical protein